MIEQDTITRYAATNGFYVERRFGWDCHGLPIEFEIDKKLGISGRDAVMKMGIAAYNAECRSIVTRYVNEWEAVVRRMGRWIDFEDDYKTMYPSFMESVWWAFKVLYEKGQVYRGFKVMPYSTACTTPLSNFEVAQNYRDTVDPSIVVKFPLEEDPNLFLLAWTTTPWTLPSNLAVCVNPNFEYVYAKEVKTGFTYVLLESRLAEHFKDVSKDVQIIKRVSGSELIGKRYKPLFGYFADRVGQYPATFTVLGDAYVSDESGTGIVHQAPGFGEDDFRVCKAFGVFSETDVPCPVDGSGLFVKPVADFFGQHVKAAESAIIKYIDNLGRLFSRAQLNHSYPFCWRSDLPLIYKAIPCWFVRVTEIIPQILEASAQSKWVPDFVQEKRFHNWISTAPDWAISRNRYWGTPIPIWTSEDFSEVICIGSVAELEELSGVKGITDLHRDNIDHITIPSKTGKGTLRRIEEVFDCWFESGCVPYGQCHYPFENKELFEKGFPADFIGEGLDQTRGWFYTLMVIGAHLFGKSPFRNLIVNGLVLAGDGKKMSKRLKNYPEPTEIVKLYGADALRIYLINSPVVRAEPLKFKEEGVKHVLRDVLLPWLNSYRFLATQIEAFEAETGKKFVFDPSEVLSVNQENVMNCWILSAYQSLVKEIRVQMDAYKLYAVMPPLVKFVECLTNGYIRMNRRYLKGDYGREEMTRSMKVLFEVLYSLSHTMSPFAPMFSEYIYQRLRPFVLQDCKDDRSVHFMPFPTVKDHYINLEIEHGFASLQTLLERVRMIRDTRNIPLKTPLREVIVVSKDATFLMDLESLRSQLTDELNVRTLTLTADEDRFAIAYKAMPNFKLLGQRLRTDFAAVQKTLKELTNAQMKEFALCGKMVVCGHELTEDDITVVRVIEKVDAGFEAVCEREFAVLADVAIDNQLRREGLARELVNRVQRLRKKAELKPTDEVSVYYELLKDTIDQELKKTFEDHLEYITKSLKTQVTLGTFSPETMLATEESEIGDGVVRVFLSKPTVRLN